MMLRNFRKYAIALLGATVFLIACAALYFRTDIQVLMAINDYEAEEYDNSFKAFSDCAEKSPVCVFYLSLHYAQGLGVETDTSKAFSLTHSAAEAGVPEAQYNEGMFYQHGLNGLAKDATIALDLYRKAAAQGHAMALNNIGNIYRYGEAGFKRNDLAAVHFKQAGDAGNTEAIYNLGLMFAGGLGVPQDLPLALALVRYATDSSVEAVFEQFEFFNELSEFDLKRSQRFLEQLEQHQDISSVVNAYM